MCDCHQTVWVRLDALGAGGESVIDFANGTGISGKLTNGAAGLVNAAMQSGKDVWLVGVMGVQAANATCGVRISNLDKSVCVGDLIAGVFTVTPVRSAPLHSGLHVLVFASAADVTLSLAFEICQRCPPGSNRGKVQSDPDSSTDPWG